MKYVNELVRILVDFSYVSVIKVHDLLHKELIRLHPSPYEKLVFNHLIECLHCDHWKMSGDTLNEVHPGFIIGKGFTNKAHNQIECVI